MWYKETIHIAHYKSTKPLYIAGGLTDDPDKCTVISGGEAKEAVAYRAYHEEAGMEEVGGPVGPWPYCVSD